MAEILMFLMLSSYTIKIQPFKLFKTIQHLQVYGERQRPSSKYFCQIFKESVTVKISLHQKFALYITICIYVHYNTLSRPSPSVILQILFKMPVQIHGFLELPPTLLDYIIIVIVIVTRFAKMHAQFQDTLFIANCYLHQCTKSICDWIYENRPYRHKK